MLMSLRPVAVQVGTTAEATVSSRYAMAGAYQVLISGQRSQQGATVYEADVYQYNGDLLSAFATYAAGEKVDILA